MPFTFYCFNLISSKNLPKVILRGSPSLLWLAANSDDNDIFQQLLACLDYFQDVGMPDPAPGGTSITQIALGKGHFDILQSALTKPSLFPR